MQSGVPTILAGIQDEGLLITGLGVEVPSLSVTRSCWGLSGTPKVWNKAGVLVTGSIDLSIMSSWRQLRGQSWGLTLAWLCLPLKV